MVLKVSDISWCGYVYKQLKGELPKSNHKDVLEKYILNLLKPGEKKGKLAKMVSFLGPELRAEAKKNPCQAEKVRTLISKFWPELSCKVEGADHHSYDENVNILRTLHQQRAFYLLEEMRVKLGNESFNNLLQEATEYDFDSLELLAFAQEDQLLTSYLHCWDAKYPDLIQRLNNEKYLHKRAFLNCASGIKTIVKIAKQQRSSDSSSQGISTSTVLMQALKPDGVGRTPLHFAAGFGNSETLQALGELLTTPAQKEQALGRDRDGCTPLHYAASSGNVETVRAVWKLLTNAVQKEQVLKPNGVGRTPMHGAAQSGNTKTLQAVWGLLTTPAQKEQALKPDKYGHTPLHLAVQSGNVEAVRAVGELLTTPAQKEQALGPDCHGWTPLDIPARSGRAKMLKTVGELYTASDLFVVIRDKRLNSKLKENHLKKILAIYPDASQEKRLIESELHLRRGQKKELSEKWKAWLQDSEECRKELLSLVLLHHEEMAEILIESLGDVLKEAVQGVLNQNISQEKKLSFLPILPPDLARSTVNQAREWLLLQAKEHPVVIEGFRGSAQDALILMRTQWAEGNHASAAFPNLQKGLAAFPPITLASLAHYPETANHLIRCLKACSDRQLSVVIPQLNDDSFREAMRHCTEFRLHLLEKATEQQKQIYLLEFEKDLGYQKWREGYEGLESQHHTSGELSALQHKGSELQLQILRLKMKIYTSERYAKERTRWQESLDKLKEGMKAIQKAYNRTSDLETKDTPEEFVCPLSGEIMKDPVRVPLGGVADRAFIEEWLNSSQTDPFTGEDLTSDMLKPDSDLKEKIAAWNDGQEKLGSNSE